MTWALERATGSAATFHSRPLPEPAVRAVWAFTVDRPAIVLGSTQPAATVDAAAAASRGIDIVRRRSGGGAVLLVPGESLWMDVIVPAGDPLWDDDVGRAAWWVGDAWATALGAAGLPDATVHRGPLVRSRWSATVCFAGLGPGEVAAGGKKVVGVSQRRTRAAARFQCSVHRRWDPATLIALLTPPRPALDELDEMVAEIAAFDDALLAAFLAALP